ncbi:preprotein translocase subunit SecG [Tenacibaculum finnmarkense]|uniref:Protein-export membrane protein SecG n=1 Tax=Tenacibaculum finnmarkense genomovar ulcerans TaxID=2781388 RepID=A0A2I2M9Q8_9FLAO|nr:preprotein translocase subunit SecG [Tenacibaculum finnmarkense]ALU75628.1 preprotein translocase subunit SecG [Tenacibaculum dicentrarchi]MBE7633053.1 preprotein translocase subunit SecG [Tenacibaculum finnmarkense genomovar ulcerans]MBE7646874.1 preprotein translocase subunit SecG [Tenacibaculum finnmarkense genomovar ulcerans]MBE7696985.1 preprotein translocase subunit SecG [Tenacibaculum finnmarkense genomovar ulcerans]MCD8409326.1 preprotein translocase subunit SecG [Tenacibaculum finn
MTTYTLLLVLILIVAIALILIVMVQNPKGGGLSSSLGGGSAQNIGGVQNTNTFLDKSTWTLSIAMFALILISNFAIPRGTATDAPQLESTLKGIEATIPAAPATTTNTTKDSVK